MGNIILGIDIGSTKICSIIAEADNDNLRIIGSGIQNSQGIKKGAIVNIEQSSKAIRTSIEDAKRIAQVDISRAVISISGTYTESFCASGMSNIKGGEVDIEIINSALSVATHNAGIPNTNEIIHVLPFRFKLDDQNLVEDPIGMTGDRLKVDAHIVTAKKTKLDNLRKAVKLAGIEIDNIVLSAYASSIAVLNKDERDFSVVCIDMGGDTCNLMIYDGNSMRYNDFFSVGSSNISSDLYRTLNTPPSVGEYIKIKYGNLTPNDVDREAILEFPKVGAVDETNEVKMDTIYQIINFRVGETLGLLSHSIVASGIKGISGIVLTGGMVELKGIREFASSIFSPFSVRIAKPPMDIPGLFEDLKTPSSSVAVGLIMYANGSFTNYEKDFKNNIKSKHLNLSKPKFERIDLLADLDINNDMDSKKDEHKNKINVESKKDDLQDKGKFKVFFEKILKNLF